ncbi:electron transport complex subunit RsxC [Agitococcus lubricus]|uniref:Ion-translocating oxidoreductase complex subunit C n=1 Tax=Agitococcus lubricus TaxID=1077255 RepID=A0A2T5IVG6_9GAMM|nr:electron transport complex subunit RsxC [Agitococcus lubricus]PTQ87869.1 electron transport complex protein RnfC [Agitococcus lubricus]
MTQFTYAQWPLIGGIHPPEHKQASTQCPIQHIPLPAQLIVPMLQHQGEEAKPIVDIGEHVLKGQKIGETRAFVAAPVHAPTSGIITAIGQYPVDHPSQLHALCVVIEPDGHDEWCTHTGLDDYFSANARTLLALIREAGIAGMGGAGFPTEAKLSIHHAIDIVVVNGMECEPYISSDDMLMRERAAEIIEGARIIRHILQAKHIIVGIEDNKPEALMAMMTASRVDTCISVLATPTRYPSGAARQTVYLLTGRETPAQGRTTDVGVFCLNVATAVAVYRAVALGEPSISRITTVTGLGVHKPANYEVLFGTPIAHLLAQADYQPARSTRLIIGGPMMGYTLPHPHIPVIKTTNCVIAATAQDFPPTEPEMPCIRCGDCVPVCPVNLLPQQLYWFSKSEQFEQAQQHHLADCIECGACAYVCPSNIPLVQYYRYAKGVIADQQQEALKSERAKLRFERRKQRITQEEAEKEARRKAKAEAAATPLTTTNHQAPSDGKSLMIAAALARSNLKKAQKKLTVAQANQESTEVLEAEIAQLAQEVKRIEAELQPPP